MNHKDPINYKFMKIKSLLKCAKSENNKSIQTIGRITLPQRSLSSVSDTHIIPLDFENCAVIPSEELCVHIYGKINCLKSVNCIEVRFWKEIVSLTESKVLENYLSIVQDLYKNAN